MDELDDPIDETGDETGETPGATGETPPDDDVFGDFDGESGIDHRQPIPHPKPNPLRRHTMGGAMLAAAMIGLQEVLEGPKEAPIVAEVGSSDPNIDDPLAVDLDPEDPAQSVAVVRPWLQRP